MDIGLAHVSKVSIKPGRQRKVFKKESIQELAQRLSNKAEGLLHPIVLENDEATLAAGERRLRAVQALCEEHKGIFFQGVELEPGVIPYTKLGDLNNFQLKEIELHENILREDLTWQEKCAAYAELDDLRRAQNPKHTYSDTAREITHLSSDAAPSSRKVTDVKNATLLTKNMHRESVAKAKNENEALKNLSRELESEFVGELAKRNTPDRIRSQHSLFHGDMFEELPQLAPNSFDCIIADPPYGIDADTSFGDMADLDHEYVDTIEEADRITHLIAKEGYRVTNNQAHVYMFCDVQYFSRWVHIFEEAGWWVWRTPLIWDKGSSGLLPYPNHGPRRCYEAILYGIKGSRQTVAVHRDIIQCANIRNKQWAAQKPVELYRDLIRRSCRPGDKILDPCCGCGPIFPAASRESVVATGIEKSDNGHAIALERMINNTGD